MCYVLLSLLPFVAISTIMAFGWQQQDVVIATIPEIRDNPLKYNQKVVRINGFLMSGHGGVILLSEDRDTGIRLRSPNLVDCPVPVQRDALFDKLWTTYTEIHRNEPDWTDIKVEIEGLVRVLQDDGEDIQEHDLCRQYPVEVITTRIISYEHEPLPEGEKPRLWPRKLPFMEQ